MKSKKSNDYAKLEQDVSQAIGRSSPGKVALFYSLVGSGKAVVSDGLSYTQQAQDIGVVQGPPIVVDIDCDTDELEAIENARQFVSDYLDSLARPN